MDQVPILIKKISSKINNDPIVVSEHWHRSIEILIPIKGSVYVIHHTKTKKIQPGHYDIINSCEIHACKGDDSLEEYCGYCIQIRYEFLKQFQIYPENMYFIQEKSQIHSHAVYDILKGIIAVYEKNDPLDYLYYWGAIYQLIYHLMYLQESSYSHKENNELVMSIVRYMDVNCREDITPRSIAQTFHFSYGYLARLFKNCLNTTLSSTLARIRIDKAAFDLINTRDSIKTIRLSYQYTEGKAFNRDFKKFYGTTPSEYRKRFKEVRKDP